MEKPLNGDLSQTVAVDTSHMDWTPSPGGHVQRKRVHRVGPAESGQVTSVVEYLPGARFPTHNHPEGEEILVLEGIFSDEQGDWPAGTYLLNPEGFRHAPFSDPGCILFVKLRQYPNQHTGKERQHVALQTRDLVWEASDHPDRRVKQIYLQDGYDERVRLELWNPATSTHRQHWPDGAELFVLNGSLEWEESHYGPRSWLRFPPGTSTTLGSQSGCELYIKEAGFAVLHSAGDAG
jgi:hypothetical protein